MTAIAKELPIGHKTSSKVIYKVKEIICNGGIISQNYEEIDIHEKK